MVAAVMTHVYGQDSPTLFRTHAFNRDERSERAHHVVSHIIPEALRNSPRARHGIHKSVVIADPGQRADSPSAEPLRPWKPRIRVRDTDTLSAARQMTYTSRRASSSGVTFLKDSGRQIPNVCVLNQASAIKPGGGFVDGVHSQEEFLCQRSTLYASLWDSLYPLPETGGIFSSDILVLSDSTPEAEQLPKRDGVFIDVISASMIRFPGAPRWKHEGEDVRAGCSCGVSYCDQDRDVVLAKMRAVLHIAQMQGAEKLVLGAWGCGSYLNPPREVARLWKAALLGTSRSPVSWPGLKEIVFAMTDKMALREFERYFADAIAQSSEDPELGPIAERSLGEDEADPNDEVQEIIGKIQETEMQLAQTQTSRTRGRLRDVLVTLNKQLAELGNSESPDNDDDEVTKEEEEEVAGEEDFVVHGYPRSDGEDNSYYNFDEDDVASSQSLTPASTYEFRFQTPSAVPVSDPTRGNSQQRANSTTSDGYIHAIASTSASNSPHRPAIRMSSFEQDVDDRRRLEETDGWFSGSVNELSALLRKTGGGVAGQNPALSPADTRADRVGFPEY